MKIHADDENPNNTQTKKPKQIILILSDKEARDLVEIVALASTVDTLGHSDGLKLKRLARKMDKDTQHIPCY